MQRLCYKPDLPQRYKASDNVSGGAIQAPARESSITGATLMRKASCACGGGCPACQSGSGKLKVSDPTDAAEIEADHIADRVMRIPVDGLESADKARLPNGRESDPKTIHRKCDSCAEEDEEEPIRRKAVSNTNGSSSHSESHVHDAIGSGGIPLDRQTRAFFESRFGYDLGGVRVHTGSRAGDSAHAVDARAYTFGNDIVFGRGEYSPESEAGRRLLAHELAHVVQGTPSADVGYDTIQRKPKSGGTKPAAPLIKTGPASSSPSLELTPSINGDPCACIVAIHTDERGARVIAKLLHANCAYNLALVKPDVKDRPVDIPNVGKKDPNELFPQDVVEECMTDEAACRKRLITDAASADKATTLKYAQTQFFLAVKECSNSFTLPVIGLHDNRTNDTTTYLDLVSKNKINVDDLKGDIDKTQPKPKDKNKPDPNKKAIDDLRKKLKGASGILDREKTTNIFRWCNLPDIGKCHIGDPKHPDNVVWVTNESDFAKLKATAVNVVLQTAAGPESKTDLSTVFLHLKDLAQIQEIEELFRDLLGGDFLLEFLAGDPDSDVIDQDKLRFINIEGAGLSHDKLSVAERVRNYESVIAVLKTVPSAYCCGDKSVDVEKGITKDLELSEADIDKKLTEQSLSRLLEALKNLIPSGL